MNWTLSDTREAPAARTNRVAPRWLDVSRGDAPLIVSLPHTGTEIPSDYADDFVSPWIARLDTDWWVDCLYNFAAAELNATVVRTSISRSVIDVNRDPSGRPLYPGRASTELCPTVTFDGSPLYKKGRAPHKTDIERRRTLYFDPYHAALAAEIARLKAMHESVVLYDCHSIRSVIPRLFSGVLPELNIGTDDGMSCAPGLAQLIVASCAKSRRPYVLNGRFKGGWITRHYGSPADRVHALQMELACRSYMREPSGPVSESNWPKMYDPNLARPISELMRLFLDVCIQFAEGPTSVDHTLHKEKL
jgi:N-formylglutamate deformylase